MTNRHNRPPEVIAIDRAIRQIERDYDRARTKDEMHGLQRKQLQLMQDRAKYIKGADKP